MASDRGERGTAAALLCLGMGLWVLLRLFAHTDLSLAMRGRQIALFFAAFAVFLTAAALVWRMASHADRRLAWLIAAVGIAMRLTLAPVRPVTTSDIYRYLWEGRVVGAGLNPYQYPPDSPRLLPLRDAIWQHVQHKRVPAAYPPLVQYVFALSDLFPTERVITLKLVLALFDIGTLLLLPGLLLRLGRPAVWVLLYAWHPLVVGEVVARGHLDTLGIFFLVLALRVALVGSVLATGACLAASLLAKGYAILTLPFILLAVRPRWALVVSLLAATTLACLPFGSAGKGLLAGMLSYASQWRGNASAFALVDLTLRSLTTSHETIARFTCASLLVVWIAYLFVQMRRGQSRLSWTDACFCSLAGFFVLSPVVYPWYLAWTVPFLCLRPRGGWLVLTGAIFAFYAHDFAGHHVEIWWVTALAYGVPLLVGIAGTLRTGRGLAEPIIGATCA